MKLTTLQEAISFTLSISNVVKYIQSLEHDPNRFVAYSISASVTDYAKSQIQVFINFRERKTLINAKEDLVALLEGSTLADFRIISITPSSNE